MTKQLSKEQRTQILALYKEDFTTRMIAKKFQVSQPTIVKTIKKYYKK